MDEIVVPCGACYNRLTVTQMELRKHPVLKKLGFEDKDI